MSAPRLHRTELLEALETELDAAGFKYREKCGRKHGRLLVDVSGREEPIIVSGTPSDHRAVKKAVAHLRRKIKSWRAEMHPEQMAIVHDDIAQPDYSLIVPRNAEIAGVDVQAVNARDLHSFLRVGKDFATWIRDRIEQYQFVENVDFLIFPEIGEKSGRGRPSKDYAITIDMAKELSMVERNEMGRAARRYFIECERQLREGTSSSLDISNGDAILDLIISNNQDLLAAQSRSAQDLVEHVEGGKAAVLRYLKMYVRETLDGIVRYQEEFRASTCQRDRSLFTRMASLEKSVSNLLQQAEQPLLSRQFVWADWYDHDKIYQTYFPNQTIPNRRFLSSAISKSLDSYCKKRQRGFDMQSRRVGGRNVNLWHKDSVEPWMNIHGLEIVNNHLTKCRRSGEVIEFRKKK